MTQPYDLEGTTLLLSLASVSKHVIVTLGADRKIVSFLRGGFGILLVMENFFSKYSKF